VLRARGARGAHPIESPMKIKFRTKAVARKPPTVVAHSGTGEVAFRRLGEFQSTLSLTNQILSTGECVCHSKSMAPGGSDKLRNTMRIDLKKLDWASRYFSALSIRPRDGRILEPPPKARGNGDGCVRSTSRSGTARPRVLGPFGDFGHPHLLRLVLRTQPRSGGGSKMRPRGIPCRFYHCDLAGPS